MTRCDHILKRQGGPVAQPELFESPEQAAVQEEFLPIEVQKKFGNLAPVTLPLAP